MQCSQAVIRPAIGQAIGTAPRGANPTGCPLPARLRPRTKQTTKFWLGQIQIVAPGLLGPRLLPPGPCRPDPDSLFRRLALNAEAVSNWLLWVHPRLLIQGCSMRLQYSFGGNVRRRLSQAVRILPTYRVEKMIERGKCLSEALTSCSSCERTRLTPRLTRRLKYHVGQHTYTQGRLRRAVVVLPIYPVSSVPRSGDLQGGRATS